jgi:hypothetical protein
MGKLGSHFQAASARLRDFAVKNPIKVYASIFLGGDLLLLAQAIKDKNWVLFGSAATLATAQTAKLIWGKGGVWDPSAPAVGLSSIDEFAGGVADNVTRLFTRNYWAETKKAFKVVDRGKVQHRLKNAVQIHRSPFDAGLLLYCGGGAGLVVDGLNIAASRPEPSVSMAATGALAILGAAGAFLIDRNDLAGPAFTASTLGIGVAGLATAVATGSLPAAAFMLAATPLYMIGDYFFGRVTTDHQSTHYQAYKADGP